MAITRAQQAKQLLANGGDVLGPLGEDDLTTKLSPGTIGRGLAFVLSGGLSGGVSAAAKEFAKQKAINKIQQEVGDIIRPNIQTKLMQQDNRIKGIGGYQSDFAQDSGFMEGKGTAAEMGSFADGGRIGFKNGPAGGASTSGKYGGDSSGGYSAKERAQNRNKGGPPGRDTSPSPVTNRYGDETKKRLETIRETFINKPVNIKKVPFGFPGSSFVNIGLGALEKPLTAGQKFTRKFNFDKVAKAGRYTYTDPKTGQTYTFDQDLALTNPEIFEEANKQLLKDRLAGTVDAYGNPITQTRDGPDEVIIPVDTTFAQAPVKEDDYYASVGGNPFENQNLKLRFRAEGGPIGVREDLAEGSMPYEGGIMDLESARQMYGLGKLVKKVGRTVKKIAKSPIGKLAIGAAILGTPFGAGAKGTGFFGSKSLFGRGLGFIQGMGVNKALLGTADYQGGATGLSSLFSKIPGGVTGAIVGASALAGLLTAQQEEEAQELSRGEGIDIEAARRSILERAQGNIAGDFRARRFRAEGGSMKEPVAKKTMPLLDMGGKEMDLRAEGGFVPIGRMEKADDVPARLSKNEFVFTADAVRNAGDGNVDKGAEVMYNMMKNLEAGGDVSKESQGLEGARRMFETSQRLEEVL